MAFNALHPSTVASVRLTFQDSFFLGDEPKNTVRQPFEISTNVDPSMAVGAEEAARLLSVCRATIYKLMNRGELPSFKCGGRRLFARKAIAEFIEHRTKVEQDSI